MEGDGGAGGADTAPLHASVVVARKRWLCIVLLPPPALLLLPALPLPPEPSLLPPPLVAASLPPPATLTLVPPDFFLLLIGRDLDNTLSDLRRLSCWPYPLERTVDVAELSDVRLASVVVDPLLPPPPPPPPPPPLPLPPAPTLLLLLYLCMPAAAAAEVRFAVVPLLPTPITPADLYLRNRCDRGLAAPAPELPPPVLLALPRGGGGGRNPDDDVLRRDMWGTCVVTMSRRNVQPHVSTKWRGSLLRGH